MRARGTVKDYRYRPNVVSEPTWEMTILDLFHFDDGQTVLVGRAPTEPPVMAKSPCDVIVDGAVFERIAMHTMLPTPRRDGLWSLSTFDTVQLDAKTIADHDCTLRATTDDAQAS